jgi:uncharacterized protein YprB with RNaseH-like and TPR domain
MFANSGRISMESVIQSIIDLKKPSRRFYKSLLINARLTYVESIIYTLVAGKVPNLDTSPLMRSI